MRPVDPELVRRSGSIRGSIAVTVLTGCIAAAASVVQAGAAAAVVAQTFLLHTPFASQHVRIALFAFAWLIRATANTVQDVWARNSGLRAVATLRQELAAAYATGDDDGSGRLALLGRGVDALEVYVARYLPQLVLAVIVPVALGAWILRNDPLSALVLAITIPLIPVFMALIGWFTDVAITKQWKSVGRITDVIDDLFAGLPDLVLFGRAKAQAALVRRLGTEATHATMRVLRISFLSSFALEIIATISVAVVALDIGLRLTNGRLDLETGLMVLILAPDVYLPLRLVGTQFHAAVEGMEAWNSAQTLLAGRPMPTASLPERLDGITLAGLVCGYDTPLHAPVDLHIDRGTMLAITGHSGAGKSTMLRTIAGLVAPLEGAVRAGDAAVHAVEPAQWFSRIGYVSQDPWLGHGSVRDALLRGADATDAQCREALDAVGLQALPLEARVDDLGTGVSVGQRRRIAMARCLLRRDDVLLLDEPTAAVDAESEAAILVELQALVAAGAIVIAVAHRPALVAIAQQVLHLERAR